MKTPVRFGRVAPLAVAALIGAGLPATALIAPAEAADGTVVGTTIDNATTGWVSSTETAGLGTVGYQVDGGAPYGGYAALLQTGPGNAETGRGGKPYLNQGGFANTPIGSLTDLTYRTKTTRSDGDPRLAPAFNIQLRSDTGFKGSLVFEPVYNKDTTGAGPSLGTWQTWNLNSTNALFYSSRPTVGSDGQTVIPANTTRRLGAFLDAWDANPTTYANMRVNAGPPGINVSLGQAGYDANTSNLVAEVDGVTIGSTTKATTTSDFESLGDCTTFAKATKVLTLTKDCATPRSQQMGDGWTFDGAGHTLTAVENDASPDFPGAVVKAAVGPGTTLAVKRVTIKGAFSGSNSGGDLAGIWFDQAGGSVSDTTIDRITHGNGVQEGQGIRVTNGTASSPAVSLDLDDVAITNYQKTGIRVNGNVAIDATGLDIGTAGTPAAAQLTTIAANGITLLNGPHGSIDDSRVAANRYTGDDPGQSGPAAQATAILLFNAGDVTATGLKVVGKDGDSGVTLVAGDDSGSLDVSCSTITREDGGNGATDPEVGIGVDNSDDLPVTLSSVGITGWPTPTVGDVTVDESDACRTTVTASAASATVSAGNAVRISGVAQAADGTGLVGTVALQAKPYGATEFTTVATGTTDADGAYTLKDTPTRNTTYRVVFTAPGQTSSTSVEVPVTFLQRISATIRPTRVKLGANVTATGSITPATGATVSLQRRVGNTWVNVANASANPETGTYSVTWKSNVSGTYSFRTALAKRAAYGASNSLATAVTITK